MARLSDHELTYTILPTRVRHKKEFVTKRWFKPSNYDDIATLLEGDDRNPMLKMCPDKEAEYLDGKIKNELDEVAPIQTKKVSIKKLNQWLNKGI